jgi:hypothetical protein
MTVRLRGPLSLALLEEKNAHGPAVQHRLETAGHRVVTFASAADLLAALGCGQRFDLLLLASPDEVTHSRLRAACEVPGMAILVVPQGAHWKGLPSWNEELVRRKHAVLQRAGIRRCSDAARPDGDGSRRLPLRRHIKARCFLAKSRDPSFAAIVRLCVGAVSATPTPC